MTDEIANAEELRAIREVLIQQMARLAALDEPGLVNDLSLVIDRINKKLGEAPSEEDIARIQRNLFRS